MSENCELYVVGEKFASGRARFSFSYVFLLRFTADLAGSRYRVRSGTERRATEQLNTGSLSGRLDSVPTASVGTRVPGLLGTIGTVSG